MPDLPPIDLFDEVRKASRERLDSCVAQFNARDSILARGEAEAAILEATKNLPADLVVVGTRGRTGLGRLALGSVAESVVREAACSVLVIRLSS
jgi:nucleotide-binding universal stress UspA family protein